MSNPETINPFEDDPFDYREFKNGKISVSWNGKEVKLLAGKSAEKFLLKIQNCVSSTERQLVMAKVTGNFKRGNERPAKSKRDGENLS